MRPFRHICLCVMWWLSVCTVHSTNELTNNIFKSKLVRVPINIFRWDFVPLIFSSGLSRTVFQFDWIWGLYLFGPFCYRWCVVRASSPNIIVILCDSSFFSSQIMCGYSILCCVDYMHGGWYGGNWIKLREFKLNDLWMDSERCKKKNFSCIQILIGLFDFL